MSYTAINCELARALGVEDIRNVRSVTLQIIAGKAPTVLVELSVRSADGLRTAVDVLRLAARPEEGLQALPPEAAASKARFPAFDAIRAFV